MRKSIFMTTLIALMAGLAFSAPADTGDLEYSPEAALATLKVVEDATQRSVETGAYSYHQDGDDLVLRKRPGRATYGDITLKKGARCNVNDCDDSDTDTRPETRLNKAELIEAIASRSGLSKADSKKALDSFADSEVKALKKGDRLKLVGLGSFYSDYCPRQMAKKTVCGTPSDYLDADSDGDGIEDGIERSGLDQKFQMIATQVDSTRSSNANPGNWMDRCTPERCTPGNSPAGPFRGR